MRPITAADLMNPKVLAVRDDLTLRELASFLLRNQITGAPVEDGGGRLVGVVSTVDIAEAVLARRGDVWTDGGETDGEEADGEEADDGPLAPSGPPLGGEPAPPAPDEDLLVRDIMTPAVFSVPEDATVSQVASRMLDGHVHRLVVTREGRAVGVITTSDLLGLLIDE